MLQEIVCFVHCAECGTFLSPLLVQAVWAVTFLEFLLH